MGRGMSCVKKERMNNRVSSGSDAEIYHEKQSKELCALHALNNLFQDSNAFTKEMMDGICQTLSPETYFNPHRSFLGLGNYDVNVIMAALQMKEYDTIWFDKRKDVALLHTESIFGYIMNIPTDLKWGYIRLPIHRKHWISVRNINGNFYNLDSKLDAPETLGNEDQLISHLKEQIKCKDKELLLVVKPSVAQSGVWYKDALGSAALSAMNGEVSRSAGVNRTAPNTSNSRSNGRLDEQSHNPSVYNPETKV